MSDFFDQLNKNSGALSAIFSGVVTVATLVYAWLTARLVDETRKMRKVQTEPRIQVTYRTREEWINFLDICVKNIGLGSAHRIELAVKPVTEDAAGSELTASLLKLGAFQNGLAYLGPGDQFSSFWTSLLDGSNGKVDSRIQVTCRYQSSTGDQYSHQFILDLSELKGSSSLGEPPLRKIAKHLETIEKDLHSTLTGFKRLGVDIFTQENRDSERKLIQEQIRKAKESE